METIVIDMQQQHPVESGYDEGGDERAILSESALSESCIEIQSLNQSDASSAVQTEVSQTMKLSKQLDFKRRITKSSQSEPAQSQHDLDSSDDHNADGLILSANWDSSTSRTWCGQDLRSHLVTLLSLLSCPTVLLTFLQGAPGCLPWGIVNSYLNDFLAEDRGMTVEVSQL
jgi:outer membrane murein-binding lipoprotein Lpp